MREAKNERNRHRTGEEGQKERILKKISLKENWFRKQSKGAATPGSGPGLGGAVLTGVQKKLNKRKFTDNDDFLREAKFVKMEKSDALPHKGGARGGGGRDPLRPEK